MKKLFLQFFFSGIIVFSLYACGGVIGSIERYRFDGVSREQMTLTIDSLYKIHPEWIAPHDSLYKLNGTYYREKHQEFYLYFDKPKPVILVYGYAIYPDSNLNNNSTTLALISGAEFGKVIGFANDINSEDKKLFKQLFEERFLKEVSSSLSVKYTIDRF